METIQNLTIEQAIEEASKISVKKRTKDNLIDKIGKPMYIKLCRLSMISEGATVDENNQRKPVWKFVERANFLYGHLINPQPKAEAS